MKKLISLALSLALSLSISSIFIHAQAPAPASAPDFTESIIFDEDGNIIPSDHIINPNARSFPCCTEYPMAGLSNVLCYMHDPALDPQCWVWMQKALRCNACRYVAVKDDGWEPYTMHWLDTEPGMYNCPYQTA